jgi:hypothetical protein
MLNPENSGVMAVWTNAGAERSQNAQKFIRFFWSWLEPGFRYASEVSASSLKIRKSVQKICVEFGADVPFETAYPVG